MLEGWNGDGECTSEKVAKIEAFRYLPPHYHNGKIGVIVGATIRERRMNIPVFWRLHRDSRVEVPKVEMIISRLCISGIWDR